MARPVWHQVAPDVHAIATLLEESAAAASTLDATPAPATADRLLLHQAAIVRARKQLRAAHDETDRVLAQEVRAIDDLVRVANLLIERLREWYALHAPEATRRAADASQLAQLVADFGERTAVMAALDMANEAHNSLGSDMAPEDLALLQQFAGSLKGIHETWRALEARIEQLMQTVAPNVASVVGAVLGARLIAQSGGIERLASWPAGTVQLLGAETALFRHMKDGSRPPKHGIMFQHTNVHQAPPWQRGAIARMYGSLVSTAASADAWTRNDITEYLGERQTKYLTRIRETKAKPPARGPPSRNFQGKPMGGRGPPRRDDDRRGPPRRDGPGGYRGPPGRDDDRRGPPRRDGPPSGGYRGPPRDGPRRDGPPSGGYRGAPRDGPRNDGPPSGGYRGPPRDGPPRDGPRRDGPPSGGYRGPPRDGPRDGPRGAPRDQKRDGGRKPAPWSKGPVRGKPVGKKKGQGAFRSDGKPAKPPGRGDQ